MNSFFFWYKSGQPSIYIVRGETMKDELLRIFPLHRRKQLEELDWREAQLEEIRIRILQPVEFCYGKKSTFVGTVFTEADLDEMITYMSRYSLYAFEEELKQGFLTLKGGFRIGVAGAVQTENGKLVRFTKIRYLNIRIARECIGCAKGVLPYIRKGYGIYNTLFISMPGMGKTTYLRDCIYALSQGTKEIPGLKISVMDERSEIAGCYLGVPQNHVGQRTDVFDACPKAEGILTAIRSMSPQVIAVDELGMEKDFQAVEQALTTGCRIIGTIHGNGMEDIKKNPFFKNNLEQQCFQRFVVITKKEGKRSLTIFNERYQEYAKVTG